MAAPPRELEVAEAALDAAAAAVHAALSPPDTAPLAGSRIAAFIASTTRHDLLSLPAASAVKAETLPHALLCVAEALCAEAEVPRWRHLSEPALAYARRAAEVAAPSSRAFHKAQHVTVRTLQAVGDLAGAERLLSDWVAQPSPADKALAGEVPAWQRSGGDRGGGGGGGGSGSGSGAGDAASAGTTAGDGRRASIWLEELRTSISAALRAATVPSKTVATGTKVLRDDPDVLKAVGQRKERSPLKDGKKTIFNGVSADAVDKIAVTLSMDADNVTVDTLLDGDNRRALANVPRMANTLKKADKIRDAVVPRYVFSPPGDAVNGVRRDGGGDGRNSIETHLHEVLSRRLRVRHAPPALRIGSWNVRVTRTTHGLRPWDLAPKVARVVEMIRREGLSAFALQECPGLGVGQDLVPLKELLSQLLSALNKGGASRWACAWTLTHSEASVFLYDCDAFEPVQISGKDCGVCLESTITPGTMDEVAGAVQARREWFAQWPQLSAAALLRKAANDAEAKAKAAEAEQAVWLASGDDDDEHGVVAVAIADGSTSVGNAADDPSEDIASTVGEESGGGDGAAAAAATLGTERWFKRPPSVILLRSKAPRASGAVVALVSVHLKATDLALTRDEAMLLVQVVPAVERLCASAGGGTVAVLGDFNLAPEGDTLSVDCASEGAFLPIMERGYTNVLDGSIPTNVDALVTSATGGRCYDNTFVKSIAAAEGDSPRWDAIGHVLLHSAYQRVHDDFTAARKAATTALRERGRGPRGDGSKGSAGAGGAASGAGAGDIGGGGADSGEDAAAKFVYTYFDGPADRTKAGKLKVQFNELVYRAFSDHKAMRVDLIMSDRA